MARTHTHAQSRSAAPVPDWAEVLRSRGLRATTGRIRILEALHTLEHATPEEVYARASAGSPGLNPSTVYRTMESLVEHGVVAHTHLDHQSTTYMLAAHADHGHVVCRGCGDIAELDPAVARALARGAAKAQGFAIDPGHVALFGVCASCQT